MNFMLTHRYAIVNKLAYSICFVSLLSGCESTQDLSPKATSSNLASISVSKNLHNRISLSGNYSFYTGSANQAFNGDDVSIQIQGSRYSTSDNNPLELDYDFDLGVSSLLLDIHSVKGKWYELDISPSIVHFNYLLDIDVNSTDQYSLNFDSFGYGLQLSNRFNFTEKFSLELINGFYKVKENEIEQYEKHRISLNYALFDSITLGLGYHFSEISNNSTLLGNGDSCDSTSLSTDCNNSEVHLSTEGLMLNLSVTF